MFSYQKYSIVVDMPHKKKKVIYFADMLRTVPYKVIDNIYLITLRFNELLGLSLIYLKPHNPLGVWN